MSCVLDIRCKFARRDRHSAVEMKMLCTNVILGSYKDHLKDGMRFVRGSFDLRELLVCIPSTSRFRTLLFSIKLSGRKHPEIGLSTYTRLSNDTNLKRA